MQKESIREALKIAGFVLFLAVAIPIFVVIFMTVLGWSIHFAESWGLIWR